MSLLPRIDELIKLVDDMVVIDAAPSSSAGKHVHQEKQVHEEKQEKQAKQERQEKQEKQEKQGKQTNQEKKPKQENQKNQGKQEKKEKQKKQEKKGEQTTDEKGPNQAAKIPYVDGNPFQKIITGQIPSYRVFETEHAIALLDAFPTVKGHCLLIPKAYKATIMDLSDTEAEHYFSQLPKLCRIVQQALKAPGVNVLNNNGKAAGQAVFHLHFHVVPRFEKDGFVGIKPSKTMISKEEAAEILASMQPFVDQETKATS